MIQRLISWLIVMAELIVVAMLLVIVNNGGIVLGGSGFKVLANFTT